MRRTAVSKKTRLAALKEGTGLPTLKLLVPPPAKPYLGDGSWEQLFTELGTRQMEVAAATNVLDHFWFDRPVISDRLFQAGLAVGIAANTLDAIAFSESAWDGIWDVVSGTFLFVALFCGVILADVRSLYR